MTECYVNYQMLEVRGWVLLQTSMMALVVLDPCDKYQTKDVGIIAADILWYPNHEIKTFKTLVGVETERLNKWQYDAGPTC